MRLQQPRSDHKEIGELTVFSETENRWAGIIFVPGRVGEEYAVTVPVPIPDGRGRTTTTTIKYETSLGNAVAFRKAHLERRMTAASISPATEGDHEQTSSQDKK